MRPASCTATRRFFSRIVDRLKKNGHRGRQGPFSFDRSRQLGQIDLYEPPHGLVLAIFAGMVHGDGGAAEIRERLFGHRTRGLLVPRRSRVRYAQVYGQPSDEVFAACRSRNASRGTDLIDHPRHLIPRRLLHGRQNAREVRHRTRAEEDQLFPDQRVVVRQLPDQFPDSLLADDHSATGTCRRKCGADDPPPGVPLIAVEFVRAAGQFPKRPLGRRSRPL